MAALVDLFYNSWNFPFTMSSTVPPTPSGKVRNLDLHDEFLHSSYSLLRRASTKDLECPHCRGTRNIAHCEPEGTGHRPSATTNKLPQITSPIAQAPHCCFNARIVSSSSTRKLQMSCPVQPSIKVTDPDPPAEPP